MGHIGRISQLGKEYILSPLHHLSRNLHGSAHSSLPERHIKYMMQTEGNQRSFYQAEDQRSHIAAACHQAAQRINPVLHYRPYIV